MAVMAVPSQTTQLRKKTVPSLEAGRLSILFGQLSQSLYFGQGEISPSPSAKQVVGQCGRLCRISLLHPLPNPSSVRSK